MAIAFLVSSTFTRDWQWTRDAWFRVAVIFWLWLVLASAVSEWPGHALGASLPWVRFPVFAAAMAAWLARSDGLRDRMLTTCMLGTLFLMGVLFVERATHPDLLRLYGTWDQGAKAGWYMLGLGTPVAMWALHKFQSRTRAWLWAGPLALGTVVATIATGEVYVSVSFVFGLCLFVLFGGLWTRYSVGLMALTVVAVLSVLQTNEGLTTRFTTEAMTRLPWLPSSDYYDGWAGGLRVALSNPVLGVGADNFESYCKSRREDAHSEMLGFRQCLTHPHQMYIQVFSETGAPGLLLFLALAATLLFALMQAFRDATVPRPAGAAALAIGIMVFWPISTYSNAFGQHRNFFTWFLIAWALASIRAKCPTPPSGADPKTS